MKNLARFFLAALLCFALPQARAGISDGMYATGFTNTDLYQINETTGAGTAVFTNYSGGESAAMAQRASDGMIFFIAGTAGNDSVYKWNPATPATAPVLLGKTGGSIPYCPRLAFGPNGTLYAISTDGTTIYTISQTTGAATSVATLTSAVSGGGDFAIAPNGTWYMAVGGSLYTIPIGGGATTTVGTLTGGVNGASYVGMAFDQNGNLVVEDDQTPSNYYTVNLSTRALTKIGSPATVELGDLASAPRVQITGNVFEDVNYGGGAGRNLATSSGVARSAARVEIYDSAGAFINATTTDASGNYLLTAAAGNTYTVRVVNSSVSSSRTGYVSTLLPVQTYRTNASSGSAVDVTDHVGGETPTLADAGNGAAGTTLASLTTATTTPQSITTVTVSSAAITGVNFGFNFDTIVNTNDSGQGSLRQFMTNANALSNTGLSQSGLTAGTETSIFMISDGNAHAGLRSGITNQLTSGVAVISAATALPTLTDSFTSINGTTQTTNIGDTNAGQLGTGGTVGIDALTLPRVNAPEVQLVGTSAIATGLDLQGNNITVTGMCVYGFGTTSNSNTSGNIRVDSPAANTLITNNVLGTTAKSFTDPGATRSVGDNIRIPGTSIGTIQNNLIGFSEGKGMGVEGGSANWQIIGNESRGNGITTNNLDGIDIESSGNDTITGNLFAANWACGIDTYSSSGGNTITNNTVTGNGVSTLSDPERDGIRLYGATNTVTKNIISGNIGSGIEVTSGASACKISQNSIFSNGTIGIDLLIASDDVNGGTSPYVTVNKSGGTGTGGNSLLNFPVITSAGISGGFLTISGYARPGSAIELFISSGNASGFGEGKTYLTTLTEGSAQDTDSGTGTYSGVINGVNQGTDTTNKFTFKIAVPAGVSAGSNLTSTATLAGATSEFSGNVIVGAGTTLSGFVYNDSNQNGAMDGSETGSGLTLYAKLFPVGSGSASQVATVTPATGAYSFTGVAAGNYTIVINGDNTTTNITPAYPVGWTGNEMGTGTRTPVAVASTDIPNLNFGLIFGVPVSGTVFNDNGAGAGTANDGVKNGAETGIPNVTVKLTDATGAALYGTTLTNGTGGYKLFVSGTFSVGTALKVTQALPPTYIATGGSPGATGGTYTRATNTVAFSTAASPTYTGVNFGDVVDIVLTTNGAQSNVPGTVVIYPHTFTAQSGGQVTFAVTGTSNPATPVWSNTLYNDANGNGQIDSNETPITAPITVTAGQSISLLLKVFIPASAAMGAQDPLTLTATYSYTNASPALQTTAVRTDLTTVGTASALTLVKTVDKTTALPGAVLTYTITYSNNTTGPLKNLIIFDTTPAYTTFVSAANGALPAGLTVVTTVPAVGAAGPIQWAFTGSLQPGGNSTVTYKVTITQ